VRFYSIAIASLTVRAPVKWTDNLVSQHHIPDVAHRDRGVARGVSWNALVRIGLIRSLTQEIGCGVREAVALASDLIDGPGSLKAGDCLALHFDRPALEARLRDRLREVIESAPRPRRGRPPKRAARNS
jgi:hypothetical protein